jgi:hypothetical protein
MDWISSSNPIHDPWKWCVYLSPSHWKPSWTFSRRFTTCVCHKLSNLWVLLCMQKYYCCIVWMHLPPILHGYTFGEQNHYLCWCHLWEAFVHILVFNYKSPTALHGVVVAQAGNIWSKSYKICQTWHATQRLHNLSVPYDLISFSVISLKYTCIICKYLLEFNKNHY